MRFTIPIKPVGQMRPRACVRGRHASVYKDKKQKDREQELAAYLLEFKPKYPMEGALYLYLDCYLGKPNSIPRTKRVHPHTGEVIPMKEWRELAERGWVRPTGKPDADNIAKHFKDILSQMDFWHDDKQVADLVVRKWYSDSPRWEVRLEPCNLGPIGLDK